MVTSRENSLGTKGAAASPVETHILLELLIEARAALPADFFELAGRIDDVLHHGPLCVSTLSDWELVEYGAGHAWLRRT